MKILILLIGILIYLSPASATEESAATQGFNGLLHQFNNSLGGWLNEMADADRIEAIKIARVVPRGAQPEIIIRRSGVNQYGQPEFKDGFTINGKTLNRGDTLRKAIEILGPEHRKTKEGNYHWDKLGIEVESSRPSNRMFNPLDQEKDEPIDYVFVKLNDDSDTAPSRTDNTSNTFTGYIDLDNVGIDTNTTIGDVRALASREGLEGAHLYIYCSSERGECFVGIPPARDGVKVHFSVDKDKDEKSKIYWLSLYFHN